MLQGRYYGAIKIGDGIEYKWVQMPGNVVVRSNKDNSILTIQTNGESIIGHKLTRDGRIIEREKLGSFFRGYSKRVGDPAKARVILRYYSGSQRTLHGISERYDQRLFGAPGKCRTCYSRGRFLWQEFRYQNRQLAFRIHHTDKAVKIKYAGGDVAGIVNCPGGFSTWVTDPSRVWRDSRKHSTYRGEVYFQVDSKKPMDSKDGQLDFSKDGNCVLNFFDRRGRVYLSGEHKNRQRVGEWIIGGKSMFLLNGVPVDKKLWETPAEKLMIGRVLRLKNAQLRAALMAKIGNERVAKELDSKVIHETRSMKLMEFLIKVDDGNGGTDSRMRILQVTCPSTKNKYYLSVPDFVWDGGRRTKLDTCEQARQWTFGVNDPRKRLKFAIET